MSDDGDVVFEADGSMTIRGGTFAMLARLADELGVTPEAALRAALAGANGENTCPNC